MNFKIRKFYEADDASGNGGLSGGNFTFTEDKFNEYLSNIQIKVENIKKVIAEWDSSIKSFDAGSSSGNIKDNVELLMKVVNDGFCDGEFAKHLDDLVKALTDVRDEFVANL